MTTTGFRLLPLLLTLLAAPVVGQEDYSTYTVLETATLEMIAGPDRTAALLSPDGSRVFHLGRREACLYAVTESLPWTSLGCVPLTEENHPGDPTDMMWSPDGTALLKSTYYQARHAGEDTDIEVIDPATLATRNLTDDNYEGDRNGAVNVDVSLRWLNARSIVFIREIWGGGDDLRSWPPHALMRIGADGSGLATIVDLPDSTGIALLIPFAIAPTPDGKQIAYLLPNDSGGVWIVPTDGGAPPIRLIDSDSIGLRPDSLTFSADGTKLLLFGNGLTGWGTIRVLDIATGDITAIAADQNVTAVAWAPTGAALAYTTYNPSRADLQDGLFLSDTAAGPGRLLLTGAFMAPVGYGEFPFIWATNDTVLLASDPRIENTVTLVRLGPPDR